MLKILQEWQGAVEVNGQRYESIKDVSIDSINCDDMHIKLYPIGYGNAKMMSKSSCDVVNSSHEIKITVKAYMTKKSEGTFDFMQKWNNDVPMPLRTMQGYVEKETRGMVYMHLHGVGQQEVTCMRCGRRLTHPVSRHYGIGPECMQKVGIVADIEDIESIKEQLINVTWSGWIIKSAILSEEEVNE